MNVANVKWHIEGVFRTQSNICDKAILRKYSRWLFSQKHSIAYVWQGSKYPSEHTGLGII